MPIHPDSLPDLLTGPGVSCGPNGSHAFTTVEATSERGQVFLCAFYEAIDKQAGGLFEDDEPLFLSLHEPGQFDQIKRQASLAGLSVGKLEDYPDYESCA